MSSLLKLLGLAMLGWITIVLLWFLVATVAILAGRIQCWFEKLGR